MAVRRPRKTLIEACYALRVRDLRTVIADALHAERPWLPSPQPHPSQEDDQQSAQPPALTTRGRHVRVRRAHDGSSALVSVSAVARREGQGTIVVAVGYLVRDDATLRTEIAELVPLPQHFGGARWMFRCRDCSQRARVLYLPPGGARFACRRCHSLTWRSVQAPGRERSRRLAEALTSLARDLYSPDELRRLKASIGIELLAEPALTRTSSPAEPVS